MKRFILGVFLATVAMFVFGAVFWTNPLPYSVLPHARDDAAAGQALLAAFPVSGTYLIPSPVGDRKAAADLTRKGPVATVHIQREGFEPMSPRGFLDGFLHEFATVALLALILKITLPAVGGYLSRVAFVTLIGVTISFYSNFSMPIWWHHPFPFYLVLATYNVVAFFIVALVLAAFVKPVGRPK